VNVIDVEMKMALMFLPVLLPESAIVLPTDPLTGKQGKARKRKVWKPTVVESLQYFIDVQEVGNRAQLLIHSVNEWLQILLRDRRRAVRRSCSTILCVFVCTCVTQ